MLGLIAITSSVLAVVIAVFVSVQCDLGASTPLQDDCLIIILRKGLVFMMGSHPCDSTV